MKRFETPIININKFSLENIVTVSGEPVAAVAAAEAELNKIEGIKEVIQMTF